ncbi:hypothetical protein HCU64_17420 [Methylobacterium sp. C25]|uniref:hypothetical protein n=1 Tax=Methylobacterium sp. C25 TaxID=2721622 RepID=UPI001F3CEA22|nr:hypothetical protein [Methylobacterium sp. C25]MCE4225536.1 hypothetical protein [Methylobacterium sp. C25]
MSNTTTSRDRKHGDPHDGSRSGDEKKKNVAPDAVKDPNQKTEGKPGLPSDSGQGRDADPGGG